MSDTPNAPVPTLAQAPTVSRRARNVIAVASGKGGVGKTWLSITLAHALSRQGKNVLLFDGDLGLANVDIQLGLMARQDLGSVISGKITLNQAIMTYEPGGFDVLAGRSGSGSLANLPPSRLQMLTDDLFLLTPAYDQVILDLGAGVDRAVRQFAKSSGTCLVVCTDEPTSLTDAYAFMKLVSAQRPEMDLRIVINTANSHREGERTYQTLLKACRGFLKISPPLLGTVRRDTRVRDAIRNQASLLTRHPNAEAARDVEVIAENLETS